MAMLLSLVVSIGGGWHALLSPTLPLPPPGAPCLW